MEGRKVGNYRNLTLDSQVLVPYFVRKEISSHGLLTAVLSSKKISSRNFHQTWQVTENSFFFTLKGTSKPVDTPLCKVKIM